MSDQIENLDVAKILWLGFLTTPFLFGVIGWVISSLTEDRIGSPPFGDPLVLILAAIAVAAMFLGAQVNVWLQSSERAEFDDGPPFQPLWLIRLAIYEGVGLLGLALVIVKSTFVVCLPFLFCSLAGLILSRPGTGDR